MVAFICVLFPSFVKFWWFGWRWWLLCTYPLPLLACIGAWQPSSLPSWYRGQTFQILTRFDPDVGRVLHSNESPLFWLLCAAPSPRFIRRLAARASMHLSPHLLISELGENHTAPYCPQAPAAPQHRSPSHQADNTLVLCQQLNTEIRHGQQCTTIDSTDWSGAHSCLWHQPSACYRIAVFFLPPPPSFSSLTRPLIQQSMPLILIEPRSAPRTEEEESGWAGVKSFFWGGGWLQTGLWWI